MTISYQENEDGTLNYTPVLMSAENPDGIPLQDLMAILIHEVTAKSEKIRSSKSTAATIVRTNNAQIIGLLLQVQAIQERSMSLLAQIGPNQGPGGKPRIGPGSDEDSEQKRNAYQH